METVVRVSIIFFFVLAAMRTLGKRDVAQLSPFELVMLMLIPDISQMGMMREDQSITNALIGLATLFSLAFLNSAFTYLSRRAEKVIQGSPTVLFHNGRFFMDRMNKERITGSEVIGSMHKAGFECLDQIKWVILEAEGELSFIAKDDDDQGDNQGESKDKASA